MKPTEFTVSTAEYVAMAGINPDGLKQHLRDAKVRGRDYLITGNPEGVQNYV